MGQEKQFTLWRGLRLSSFQIGSAMGDILVASIWKSNPHHQLRHPGHAVGLLIALRYLLSPLSLWAGNLTDNKRFFGLRRTPLIWLGRAMMVFSLPFLGLSVTRLAGSNSDPFGWTFALLSSLMYGVGTLISGSPFLALVRESAPEERQGSAISMVETVLIIFFTIAGIGFGILTPTYDPQTFQQMIAATMIIGGFFWFFAVVGIERRDRPAGGALALGQRAATGNRLGEVVREVWGDRRTRSFFVFLSLGTLAAWAGDAVLEPFGADVFNLTMGMTTRFNSYWQTATVITLVTGGILWRKRPPERQGRVAAAGLLTMGLGLVLLATAGVMGQRYLIEIALFVFGGGFGIYTFGGLSLMAVMSPDRHAGAYLGLWSISILVSKGLGTFLGGALRDLFLLQLGLSPGLSYGIVFLLQASGLATGRSGVDAHRHPAALPATPAATLSASRRR